MLTGASHTTAVTAKPKKKKRRKRNSSSVPEAATSDFQPPAQSGVGGAAIPSVKRQMDGDFLLCAFTGVVTVQCESDPVSQFDKWGIAMKANQRKRLVSAPAARPKVRSIFQLYWSLPPTRARFRPNRAASLPPSLPGQQWGAFHADERAGGRAGGRPRAERPHCGSS